MLGHIYPVSENRTRSVTDKLLYVTLEFFIFINLKDHYGERIMREYDWQSNCHENISTFFLRGLLCRRGVLKIAIFDQYLVYVRNDVYKIDMLLVWSDTINVTLLQQFTTCTNYCW